MFKSSISGIVILLCLAATSTYAQLLTDFQYLTNSQIMGGGPYSGSLIPFSEEDVFEGPVHTNGQLHISTLTCPQFSAFVSASNGIEMGGCSPSIFTSGYTAEADSFHFPNREALDQLKSMASHLFVADSLVHRADMLDTLIMTELLFSPGGFNIRQWTYQIPPISNDSSQFSAYEYYHNHPLYAYCQIDGFHHFDFEPILGKTRLLRDEFIQTESGIIYVRGGQLRLSGVINGQFTIITDRLTEYQRPDTSGMFDYSYNNIWLLDNLIYEDADSITGAVPLGSTNRLGLISGANIIVANTIDNGGQNSAEASDILINAALVTLEGSFVAQYWQNSSEAYSGPAWGQPEFSKADGRGPYRSIGSPGSGGPVTTGSSDLRGEVYLWGCLIQSKPGYLRRRAVGPYDIYPGIGYDKTHFYDFNMVVSPPPGFEVLINAANPTSLAGPAELPPRAHLTQNYPNPFNPSTHIQYDLPELAEVSILIFDLSGRVVQNLLQREQTAGQYEILWNGFDKSGMQVPAGMYIVRLQAGEYSSFLKMIYLH